VKPRAAITAIDSMQKSRGWLYIKQVMEEEIVQSAMAIAETPNMPLDEINFRRGSIWAAKALLDLPDRVRLRLENELALSSENDKTK
jgi:hypothetical protein